MEPAAFGVREEVRLVEGRVFRPGTSEIIVGRSAARQFDGLDLGSTQRWGESEWEVVGVFEAGGAVAESEIWCDARVLQPAYRRGDTFQSVHVKLASADDFEPFKDALTSDPRLDVMVEREDAWYQEQSQVVTGIITGIGTVIALLMAVGAVFGGVNTMYTAVAARTREIATLRALGFGGAPVVISVLVESVGAVRRRRRHRRAARLRRLQRPPDRHAQLADLQPSGVRLRGDPRRCSPRGSPGRS